MKRSNVPRPRCGGLYTEARYRSFITSALRRAKWPVKYAAVKRAFVKMGTNPATGRKCKLHRCEMCHKLFPQNQIQADHLNAVIDPTIGFVDWNTYIERMFCEIDNFQAICKTCHSIKTTRERAIATERRRNERK